MNKIETNVAIDQYRHECEIRSILAMRARNEKAYIEHMALIKQKRQNAFPKIESDALYQWKMGNRGKYGEWR